MIMGWQDANRSSFRTEHERRGTGGACVGAKTIPRRRELGFKCDDVANIFGVVARDGFTLVVGVYERRRGRACRGPERTPAWIETHAHG